MACLLDKSMVERKLIMGPGKHKSSHKHVFISGAWIYIEEKGKTRKMCIWLWNLALRIGFLEKA